MGEISKNIIDMEVYRYGSR